MRRYARAVASITVAETAVDSWLVIRTDEVAHAEVLAKGFIEIPAHLSDDEVKGIYHVACIYDVRDDRTRRMVN
jgi:hypothetical protein